MRSRRITNKNNLVIVCEGTDTEYLYFTDMKDYVFEKFPDRYTDIKVVPVPEEVIKQKNPNRRQKRRPLISVPQYHYYCKYENNASDYEKYCAQPTRYVRETALFMKQDGYQEGWAIFDNDKHPAHKFAFEYANEDHVKIGFSSYSFEEWLLAHFERCAYPFQQSECIVENKHLKCGTPYALTNECQGSKCIAGYLRVKGYLPDYSKNKPHLFRDATLPHIRTAMRNAAWLRSLSNEPIYLCNPYTDVDILVASVLQLPDNYKWCHSQQSFRFANSQLRVSLNKRVMKITNVGKTTVIINPSQMKVFLKDDSFFSMLVSNISLEPEGSFDTDIPTHAEAVLFQEGYSNTYVELK